MKQLIPKQQKGNSVKTEDLQENKQQEQSASVQKKELIPKKRKSKYLNPEFVNDRPVPMLITNKRNPT